MIPHRLERDIVSRVLECVENIASAEEGIRRSFRSRARDIPSDLFTRGLTYSLIYLAARSSAISLNTAFKATKCSDIIDSLKKIELKAEEKGYALYGATMIYVLRQIRVIEANNFSELIAETLEKPLILNYAMIIAEWVKRFAEAYIETEAG